MEFDINKILHSPLAAGVAGSVIGLRFAPGLTWLERVANVMAGSFTAAYATPGLASWFDIQKPEMLAAMAFALGLFGLSLAAAVMQGVRELRLAEIITGWISRRG
jgi:hypothetical protein